MAYYKPQLILALFKSHDQTPHYALYLTIINDRYFLFGNWENYKSTLCLLNARRKFPLAANMYVAEQEIFSKDLIFRIFVQKNLEMIRD